MAIVGVSFSEEGAKRIGKVVRRIERMPQNTPGDTRRADSKSAARMLIRGKLDSQLTAGGSATMSEWAYNGSTEADTLRDRTVYDWMLSSGDSMSSGKKVVAIRVGGRFYVISGECG